MSEDTQPLPTPPEGTQPSRSAPPVWMVATAVGLGVAVVLVAVGAGWAWASQRAELRQLRTDVVELREEVARAEVELEAVEEDGGGGGGLFDGLFDGLGDGGGLEGLFGEGLDGFGPDPSTLACMQPPDGVALPDIPADGVDAQIAAIAGAVEALRGLEFDDEPPVAFRPGDEFAAELRRAVEEDYPAEQAEVDAVQLAVLGAVEEGVDLREMQMELVGEQAAGFYQPETGEVVVRGDGDGRLTAQERVFVAHELEHALADEQIGLPPIGAEVADPDQAYGHLSAVEGGAVLVQSQFTMGTLGLGEQLQLSMDPQLRGQLEQLREYPHMLQRSLLFPYEDGFAFACGHYQDGGVEALDGLVAEPPESSAEVLFPDRFDEGRPAAPELGSLPGSWQERETTTFGAAELLWLLEAPGDDPDAALDDPQARAAGWDGGAVSTWTAGGDAAVGLALAQRDGEPDLCETMAEWHEAAFPAASPADTEDGETRAAEGDGQAGVVACDGDVVRVGLAPTLADARRLTR